MLSHSLLPLVFAALVVAAPDPDVPRPTPSPNPNPTDTANPRLIGKRFPYENRPHMADTFSNERGIQIGYNDCNNSTAGQTSMCQTAIVNSIDDFCIWGPPEPKVVGDAEAGMVAFCTKPGYGTRLIPAGALKAVQFLNAKSYIAIAGRVDGPLINIPSGDTGGELDSGGQDGRGNPIGALVYSSTLPSTRGKMTQGIVWTQFVSDGIFCIKVCDNAAPNAANLCEHIYDTQGCGVNLPAAYVENTFETCDSDDMLPVFPTRSAIPASSNCKPTASADVYKALPTAPGSGSTTTASASATGTGSVSGGASGSGSPRPTGGASPTGSSPAGASGTNTPGGHASKLGASAWAGSLVALAASLVGAAIVA